ncbi:MAG: FHA domain-containing protein [Pyrinomonadaceae bacterium]|nr:FHA domain-containing protein [Pyrinomonadaceae bacterium]
MDEYKLIINGDQEHILDDEIVTVGRAPDNLISFSDDPNVSRYHAEIEKRGDEYWVIELGSFNGSTLNGEEFEGEKPLFDGDELVFGGTSEIRVLVEENEEEDEEEEESEAEEQESPKPDADEPEKKPSKMPVMLIVAALAVGLAVILVAAAGLFYFTRQPSTASACDAQASITSPGSGETITEPTNVEIDLQNGECVSAVSYRIEGKEFARATSPPFSVSVNPDTFPQFADGLNRNLKAVLLDPEGKEIDQSREITLFMETIVTETPEETPTGPNVPIPLDPKIPTQTPTTASVSLSDSVKMSENTIKQFSGSFQYNARNPNFLREVNRLTAEYVEKGYYARAKKYRDVINIQYIQERSLDPPLPYILGMSRSKFKLENSPEGVGIWKMSNELVASKGYNGLCRETIEAPNQRCAAIASAAYLEEIIINVFDGDFIYGIAAFGMTTQQAESWKASLPADPAQRADFWNVIKSRRQREQVVRFFAAAMVAENPQKFGLRNDRPLSDLYKVYMRK